MSLVSTHILTHVAYVKFSLTQTKQSSKCDQTGPISTSQSDVIFKALCREASRSNISFVNKQCWIELSVFVRPAETDGSPAWRRVRWEAEGAEREKRDGVEASVGTGQGNHTTVRRGTGPSPAELYRWPAVPPTTSFTSPKNLCEIDERNGQNRFIWNESGGMLTSQCVQKGATLRTKINLSTENVFWSLV